MPLRQSALCVLFCAVTFAQSLASELVMVERPGCPWCARWTHDVAPLYGKTPEASVAPLRRMDVSEVAASGIAISAPVRFTPTFLLVDGGREIGRMTGYINDDMFWGLLDKLLADKGLAAKDLAPAQASAALTE